MLCRVPEEAVHSVNTTLSQGNPSLMFVTLLIAVFDGRTSRLGQNSATVWLMTKERHRYRPLSRT